MKIGFDAKRAFTNSTGIGNYSRSLIQALSIYYPDNTYCLYTPNRKTIPQAAFLNRLSNVTIKRPPAYTLSSAYWRTFNLCPDLIRDRIELYHGLSHELPVGIQKTGIKSIVTIHDLIFLRYPQYYHKTDRYIYNRKFQYACHHADRIIAISRQTKKDLITFYRVPPEKIEIVYQSCAPEFSVRQTHRFAEIRTRYHLPETFLLNVGTIEPRKNLLLIVQALPFIDPGISLVVIGKPTPYIEQIKDFIKEKGLSSRVIFLQGVPFDDLPALYQMATIFIYPSRFEGFGIPVLEALNAGVPVIAATGSCLEEAGGPDSLYLSPDDPKALADAITRLWDNDTWQQQMIQAGKAYAALFTEKETARNIWQVYQKVSES